MLRAEVIRKVLDLTESGTEVGVVRLAESGGMSVMSARRAAAFLTSCGVLVQRKADDPETGRRCRVLYPSDGGRLLAVDLSAPVMTARVLPLSLALPGETAERAGTVAAQEPQGDFTVEECLRLLMSRARRTLLPAHGAGGVLIPVLILPEAGEVRPPLIADPPERLARVVADSLSGGTETVPGMSVRTIRPVFVTGRGAALRRALTGGAWARGAASVLYLRTGENPEAVCLCRADADSPWFEPPLLRPLPDVSRGDSDALPAEYLRLLAPDVLITEGFAPGASGTAESADARGIRYDHAGVPLHVLGAALAARRRYREYLCGLAEV